MILADLWTLLGRMLKFYLETLHYSFTTFSLAVSG